MRHGSARCALPPVPRVVLFCGEMVRYRCGLTHGPISLLLADFSSAGPMSCEVQARGFTLVPGCHPVAWRGEGVSPQKAGWDGVERWPIHLCPRVFGPRRLPSVPCFPRESSWLCPSSLVLLFLCILWLFSAPL